MVSSGGAVSAGIELVGAGDSGARGEGLVEGAEIEGDSVAESSVEVPVTSSIAAPIRARKSITIKAIPRHPPQPRIPLCVGESLLIGLDMRGPGESENVLYGEILHLGEVRSPARKKCDRTGWGTLPLQGENFPKILNLGVSASPRVACVHNDMIFELVALK
ncbi:hypothetical protein [Rothia nasimurium]|uniref:hypothetical protein n=1 Tax=Rothia nasimurium TaxID=85336 RepID=UPI001F4463E4|nr:hypothetical protein [Rothia nasimurium]